MAGQHAPFAGAPLSAITPVEIAARGRLALAFLSWLLLPLDGDRLLNFRLRISPVRLTL